MGVLTFFLPKNCMKMKEFGPQGAHIPGAPLDRQCPALGFTSHREDPQAIYFIIKGLQFNKNQTNFRFILLDIKTREKLEYNNTDISCKVTLTLLKMLGTFTFFMSSKLVVFFENRRTEIK